MSETAPPPPPSASTGEAAGSPKSSKDDANMAFLLYLLAIPTGFVGPLIIWLLKKEQSPFIDTQGKEVLNWNITVLIAWLCCLPLILVGIGLLLMPVVIITHIVLLILGALKVRDGYAHRFPFALRLLK